MNSLDLEVGQWYKVKNASNDRYSAAWWTVLLTELNIKKGHHRGHVWQLVHVPDTDYKQRHMYGKVSDHTIVVSSRAIHTPIPYPGPEQGTPEWAALQYQLWETSSKHVLDDYRKEKAHDIAYKFLPVLGVEATAGNSYMSLRSFNNIERLHKCFIVLLKHDLMHEVFDITDTPVLQSPIPTDEKETEPDDNSALEV